MNSITVKREQTRQKECNDGVISTVRTSSLNSTCTDIVPSMMFFCLRNVQLISSTVDARRQGSVNFIEMPNHFTVCEPWDQASECCRLMGINSLMRRSHHRLWNRPLLLLRLSWRGVKRGWNLNYIHMLSIERNYSV